MRFFWAWHHSVRLYPPKTRGPSCQGRCASRLFFPWSEQGGGNKKAGASSSSSLIKVRRSPDNRHTHGPCCSTQILTSHCEWGRQAVTFGACWSKTRRGNMLRLQLNWLGKTVSLSLNNWTVPFWTCSRSKLKRFSEMARVSLLRHYSRRALFCFLNDHEGGKQTISCTSDQTSPRVSFRGILEKEQKRNKTRSILVDEWQRLNLGLPLVLLMPFPWLVREKHAKQARKKAWVGGSGGASMAWERTVLDRVKARPVVEVAREIA